MRYFMCSGLGIKRWSFLLLLGLLLMMIGSGFCLSVFLSDRATGNYRTITGLVCLAAGGVSLIVGIRGLIISVAEVLVPEKDKRRWLFHRAYKNLYLKRGPRVVAIGGGTGLPVLLRGIKDYTNNITAIVTVADDGGSSGRLRGDFGILPPGDIRNCLVALADTETLMDKLLNYRFGQGQGLTGHSLGNLLLTAMTHIAGDFQQAIKETGKVLAVRGQVLPSTLADVQLVAELSNDTLLKGQSNIASSPIPIKRVFLEPDVEPVEEAINAIREADAIFLGPGSLYTSVLPNLLVSDLADALRSSNVVKCYVCNVMTQPGETTGFKVSDHLQAIIRHGGAGLVTHVLVNTRQVKTSLLDKYLEEKAEPVILDRKAVENLGVCLVTADLIDETEVVRHDPVKLGKKVMELLLGG